MAEVRLSIKAYIHGILRDAKAPALPVVALPVFQHLRLAPKLLEPFAPEFETNSLAGTFGAAARRPNTVPKHF